jgi:ribosomal protein L37AE/L43A
MPASCIRCGDEVATKRSLLGYRTCLSCGDKEAKAVTRVTAPINKSAYMLISNIDELSQLNPKRTGG